MARDRGRKPRETDTLGHSPLALAAPPDAQEPLPFAHRAGVQHGAMRPAAVSVPLPRSSGPRAVSGLAASLVDVRAGSSITVDPLAPRQYLPFLTTLAVIHPALSQAIKLLRANANRGHSVVFDAPEGADALIEQAQARLDAFNARIYPRGGVDGLINSLLTQLCITGALSAEDVIRPGKHVERVVSVPVGDVEFYVPADADDGDWQPFQRTGRELRRLDPRTYSYSAWQTLDNNPYGIPPFIAAINAILREEHIWDQLDLVLEKVGWLGLLAIKVPLRPEDKDELRDEDERYRERQTYLSQLATNLGSNFRKGITLFDEGFTLDYEASPAASMAGATEIFRSNEEQIFSGLGLDPALFGRTWAKSETWIGMAKSILEDQCAAFQRLVGTRLEKSLATDFALGAMHLKPWVQFDAIPTQRPAEQAAADAQRWTTTKDMAQHGLIDTTTAARQHGYDEWADPSKLNGPPQQGGGLLGFRAPDRRVRMRLDSAMRRYEVVRPTLPPITLAKPQSPAKPRRRRGTTYATIPGGGVLQRLVTRFLDRYAGKLAPVLDDFQFELLERLKAAAKAAPSGQWRDPDEFGTWAIDQLNADFRDLWREKGMDDEVMARVLETHREMGEAWRREDRSIWAGKQIPQADPDAEVLASDASALARSDAYHMSIYLEGMSSAERATLQKMLSEELDQAGRDIANPDVMDDFLNRMERSGGLLLRRRDHGREGGAESETDEQARERMAYRVQRIAETAVMRSRNVAAVRGLAEDGIDEFEVVQLGEAIEGEICTEMNGHIVRVEAAVADLDAFLESSPEQQEETLSERRTLSAEDLKALPGLGLPPLHPWCRCVAEAVL